MKYFTNIIKILAILLTLLCIIFYVNTEQNKQNVNFKQINIYPSELKFINEAILKDYLVEKKINFDSCSFDECKIDLIESYLDSHPNIKNAEVFIDISGDLIIDVEQRTPVARIMSDNISYYIDELGQSIPISNHYTARLIIVTGQIERNQHQDISRFVNAIICDTFWNSQLTQIDYINNEYVLVPSVGNHKIYFGLLENIDEKLDNLYQLYRQILPIKGWQTYSKINLKFKDQIICTKR